MEPSFKKILPLENILNIKCVKVQLFVNILSRGLIVGAWFSFHYFSTAVMLLSLLATWQADELE